MSEKYNKNGDIIATSFLISYRGEVLSGHRRMISFHFAEVPDFANGIGAAQHVPYAITRKNHELVLFRERYLHEQSRIKQV